MQRHLHHNFKVFPQYHLPMTWTFKIRDNRLFVTKFKKVFALTPCVLRFPPPTPKPSQLKHWKDSQKGNCLKVWVAISKSLFKCYGSNNTPHCEVGSQDKNILTNILTAGNSL